MTISSSTSKSGPYNGNGVTTVFARNFRVLLDDHLKVYQTVSGVTTEVTTGITKDSIGSDSGNVTFATAPATGAQITLVREVPLTQETDYSSQGKVPPVQVEDDFDLQEMQIQDIAETVGRAIRLPINTMLANVELPNPASGKVIIGKSDGSGWEEGPSAGEIAAAQANATTATTSASEAAASAVDAATSESNAAASASTASTKASEAAASASAAAIRAPSILANDPAYGLSTSNTGAQNDAAMALAVAAAVAGDKKTITMTGGTYLFEDGFLAATGVAFVGHGAVDFKLSDTADDNASIIRGNTVDDGNARISDVVITGLTLDGNHARSATIGDLRPGGSCVMAANAYGWVIHDNVVKGAKLHGIDVTNGGEKSGSDDRNYSNGDNTHYPSNGSMFCYVIGNEVRNCGDDPITTHFSSFVWIAENRCYDASGRLISSVTSQPTPSNGIEVDDGSLYVFVYHNYVETGNAGLVAKCHDGFPAAGHVVFDGNIVRRCARGVYLNDPNTGGRSASARNIKVINNTITEPEFFSTASTDIHGIRCGEYVDVVIENNHIEGVDYDNDTANGRETKSAIFLENGCHVRVGKNTVRGWIKDNESNDQVGGIHVEADVRGSIRDNSFSDCGFRGAIFKGSTGNLDVSGNYHDNDQSFTAQNIAFIWEAALTATSSGPSFTHNREDGADLAVKVGVDEYTSVIDFEPNAKLTTRLPCWHAQRTTDIDSTVTGDFGVDNYNTEVLDRAADFDLTTGKFRSPNKALFSTGISFEFINSDLTVTDDSMHMVIRVTSDPDGTPVDEDYVFGINPRGSSTNGIEYFETVTTVLEVPKGADISARLHGVSASTTVDVKEVRFWGHQIG